MTFVYDYPANVKHWETFTLDFLAGKRGLFDIKFIGNGQFAKAVI